MEGKVNFFKLKQDGDSIQKLEITDKPRKARTLIYDIETAPNLAYVWGKYQQDVIDYHSQWYIMCIAWKWLGEDKTYTACLRDFETYAKDPTDDKELIELLHSLFNQRIAVGMAVPRIGQRCKPF